MVSSQPQNPQAEFGTNFGDPMSTLSILLAISPLDGRYREKCNTLSNYVSEFALNRYRLLVEIKWFITITKNPSITDLPPLSMAMQSKLLAIYENFNLEACQRIKAIELETNHDVKSVEYFLKESLNVYPEFNSYLELIHFACTSEDINNLSYALMLKDLKSDLIVPQLKTLREMLGILIEKHKNLSMLSRTHGQAATPTTLGKEFANVAYRLKRQIDQLESIDILGKINGAVGNFNAHEVACPQVDWIKLAKEFVEGFGLTWNPLTTQIEPHDYQAELFHCLTRVNTILIDFSRDIWSYISLDYFKQKMIGNEVGSSTMPHKINPIDFENAEGNLGISSALLTHMAEKLPISRWQRDLTDSTVQRNFGVAIGHHTLAMQSLFKGLKKLEVNEERILADLNNHWEVLGEAIQTVLRKYQVPNAYEQLKAFTRGKAISSSTLGEFIETLKLPLEVKNRLKHLTPERYVGLANELIRYHKK